MDATIIDLIHPHTGNIDRAKPTSAGYGAATTGLVESAQGRFFVKATPRGSRNLEAAQREAAVNPFVRSVSPVIRWQAENDDWFVLGFEAVEGRNTNFLPESTDLPTVINIVNRVTAVPLPEVAREWQETRWDRFTTDVERELLRGDALTHTDIHGRNILISGDQSWLVDWEWPTRAAAAVMPSCLAVQLVSSGHPPEAAQSWVSKCTAWQEASEESVAVFARADARMHRWFAKLRPEEKWLEEMADAAEAWAAHVDT